MARKALQAQIKDVIILSGGPRSRSTYFADEWETPAWANVRKPYHRTDRFVTIGQIYSHLPDERLAGVTARVWEWRRR